MKPNGISALVLWVEWIGGGIGLLWVCLGLGIGLTGGGYRLLYSGLWVFVVAPMSMLAASAVWGLAHRNLRVALSAIVALVAIALATLSAPR